MANVINFILPFLPELLLAFFASQLLVFGVAKKERTDLVRWIAIGLLVVYALASLFLGVPGTTAFNGALINDSFSYVAKAILGLSAAAALLFSESYLKSERLDKYEFSVLVLYAVLGMSIMVSSNNLLSLYIGIDAVPRALCVSRV